MIEKRSVIAGPTFISLGLIGVFFAFWGTTLPALRTFLDIDIEKAAILTAYIQASHAITCLLGGILSDLIRRDKVLMAGGFFLGSGVLLLGVWPSFEANIFLVFLVFWMGIGTGLILSASNALLVALYPDRKGTIMNIHHGFFGVGSLISPLIMGHLLSYQNRWQYGYDGLGVFLLAICLFFVFIRVPTNPIGAGTKFFSDVARLFSSSSFVNLTGTAFLAIGTQFAIMFLSVTLLVETKGFAIFEASMVLSLFFTGLFLGRLVCSWLAMHIVNSKIILFLLFFQVISVLVALKGDGWVSAVAVATSGLACSGIFPCLLALTGTLFYELMGTSMGVLSSMTGLGGMAIVRLSGLLSQRVSLEFGFIAMVLASVTSLIVFSLKYRIFVREEKSRIVAM